VNVIDLRIESDAAGVLELYAIGDLHSDRKEFNELRFKSYRDHIIARKKKGHPCVAVFVGDAMEGRTPGMKHFDANCVRPEFLMNLDSYIKQSLDWNRRLLKPLVDAGVPLVILEGNHDRFQEYSGYAAMLADRVGAHFLGGEGFIRVRSGSERNTKGGFYTTVIYATHGTGGGKRPGGKINEMQSTLEWVDADVVIKGHVHDGAIRIIHRFGVPRKGNAVELTKIPQVMYRAPSFVERAILGVVSYAGRQCYPSSDDGLQYVVLNPQLRTAERRELTAA
jgi:predicted phosphodiesterase